MGFTCRCDDGGRGRDGVLHGLTLILIEAKAIVINKPDSGYMERVPGKNVPNKRKFHITENTSECFRT